MQFWTSRTATLPNWFKAFQMVGLVQPASAKAEPLTNGSSCIPGPASASVYPPFTLLPHQPIPNIRKTTLGLVEEYNTPRYVIKET